VELISGRPSGRRGRARRSSPLRRADIIADAIGETELGRLDELTMRGIADRLLVTPMALYAHVADKDEILDEVLDHVLGRLPMPVTCNWRGWMSEFAEQLHQTLRDHPALLDRYLRRPVGVRAAVARMEAAFAVLHDAQFDDDECVDVYAELHACTVGFSALEVTRHAATIDVGGAPLSLTSDTPGFWPAYCSMLDETEFPNLSRIRPDLDRFATAERFLKVVRDLLASHQPRPARRPRRRNQETEE